MTGVTFAERLICNRQDLVVLQNRQNPRTQNWLVATNGPADRRKSNCFYKVSLINCCDCSESQMNLHAGAQHEGTLEVGALQSVHCFQGKDMPVL